MDKPRNRAILTVHTARQAKQARQVRAGGVGSEWRKELDEGLHRSRCLALGAIDDPPHAPHKLKPSARGNRQTRRGDVRGGERLEHGCEHRVGLGGLPWWALVIVQVGVQRLDASSWSVLGADGVEGNVLINPARLSAGDKAGLNRWDVLVISNGSAKA